jgi:LysR family hydrogen peroxide-inducible transcriptional activator
MNLQQLEYLLALDKFKNFSKAAAACHVAQATLSAMIKKLEEELGVVLFDRKTNPIITTVEGQVLLEEAQKTLFHARRMRILAAEQTERLVAELRLGVLPTIAGNLLPKVLPEFLKNYQGIQLLVEELPTEEIVERLQAGQLDAGIVSTPLEKSELEEEWLYYEKLLVYGHRQKKNQKFLKPKDLTSEAIWLLEKGHCLSDQVMQVCALQQKQIESNLVYQPNSFESLLNMVDAFNGITLLPELFVQSLPKQRQMKVSEFVRPFPVREVSLVYHRPFAKLKIIGVLGASIRSVMHPQLSTTQLRNREMRIAKI